MILFITIALLSFIIVELIKSLRELGCQNMPAIAIEGDAVIPQPNRHHLSSKQIIKLTGSMIA
jgi:hypothetical protein